EAAQVMHAELHIPPLRERIEDIWPIARAMLAREGRPIPHLAHVERIESLLRHDLRGNARELVSIVRSAPPAGITESWMRAALAMDQRRSKTHIPVGEIRRAPLSALPRRSELERLVFYALSIRLDDIAAEKNREE